MGSHRPKPYRRRRKQQTAGMQEVLIIGILLLVALIAGGLSWGITASAATEQIVALAMTFVLVVAGVSFIVGFLRKQHKLRALRALQLADIDGMTGTDFERYVGALLVARGWRIKYTKTSGDFGVDLLGNKDGITSAIQLKRYNHSVGLEAVQQAVAGRVHYGRGQAMVVTNNMFTRAARELAASNHCQLVDREQLAEWVLEFQENTANRR